MAEQSHQNRVGLVAVALLKTLSPPGYVPNLVALSKTV